MKKSKIPFLKLSEEIQQEIISGKCPLVLPSIMQLAEHYSAGASTVKRSINRLKELNYLEGVQGKCINVNPSAMGNYFFGKNIVVYLHLKTLGYPFYLSIIDHLRQYLEDVNSFLHIFSSPRQLKNCGFTPDVMIVAEIFNKSEISVLAEHCPQDRILKLNNIDKNYCCIGTDNFAAGYMAMDYLYRQCGHRAIGIISTQLEYSYGPIRLRYDGAINFGQEHDDMELYSYGLKDLNNGQQAAAFLLNEHPQISAIFVTMDFMGIGVYRHCQAAGLTIAKDISILGFDNSDFSSLLLPGLSTYQENVDDIFQFLRERINCIINDKTQLDSVMVKPNLIVRESVKVVN